MNEILQNYFRELEQYSDLSDMDNELRFAEIVDKIALTRNPKAIPLLLRWLDDNSNSEDIAMQGLANRIESFGKKEYIPALLTELKNTFIRAPQECSCFFYRIFNSPQHLLVLKENIHLADRGTLLKLFNYMENDRPSRKQIIAELRELVNK
jgi:hypothetical protein